MAQKKVDIDTLLGIVARKLEFNRPALESTSPNGTQHDEASPTESTSGPALCVLEVLKPDCDEVYRFRTDGHDESMPGPHRCSYNELLRRWRIADPGKILDGGSFPAVQEDGDSSHEFWVSCTCTRCSHGVPVQLWCEPYEFKRSVRSKDTIVIHKFKCNGQDWAVILDEHAFQEWRLWGYLPKDQPDATYYNLSVTLSSSHAPSTSISGREKRAAQRSTSPVHLQHESSSAAGSDNDEGEHMEDEGDYEQSVRTPHDRRRAGRRSRSPDRDYDHRSNGQNTPQRSRTPAPQRIPQRGKPLRRDNKTHDTTTKLSQNMFSPLTNVRNRTGVDSNPFVSNKNDIPHSNRRTSSSNETPVAAFPNITSTRHDPPDQTRSDPDDTNIHYTDQSASASASDLQAKFDEILLHVLSQPDIDSDSKLQKLLQVLERAAGNSNDWQFYATRSAIARELAKADLQPLP